MTTQASASKAGVLHTSLILVERGFRPALTSPRSTFTMIVYPLLFFLGFYAVLQGLLRSSGIDYAQFLAPGVIVQSTMLVALATAFFLASDRRTGMLARLRSLPIPAYALLVARLALDALRALVAVTTVAVVAAIFGFGFERGILPAVGFVVLAVLFAVVLSIGTAAIGYTSTDPEVVTSSLTLPYVLLVTMSTAFVPSEAFPDWLEPVVAYSPISAVADALRALATSGTELSQVWLALAWIVVLAVVFLLLAVRNSRRAT
ncbi:ABC transporter permease [Salinactinospora qingdaonensis]|uniref:ABC transporter permease n=1 Tax=Salinactinospora qingdaonensis TaxID=702744 RepID=A0ABP7F9M8_9ACTN